MQMESILFKVKSVLLIILAGLISCSICRAESNGVAYVTNQDGGVNVIDLKTLEIIGSLDPQAKSPRGLGVTSDGKYLITANKDDGNIAVIEISSGKLVNHITIGKNPEFVRILGDKAFVSFEPSSKGGPPPRPGEIAKSEEADDDKDEPKELARIAIIDLKQGRKIREIIGGPETEGLEFSKTARSSLSPMRQTIR